jgi:phage baseplate assembly protein W
VPSLEFPLASPLGGPAPASTDLTAAQRDVYGKDKFFNGAPVVTGKGDWQTVEAEENLRRAILRRMLTAPGTYRAKPNYGVGVDTYVKKPYTRAVQDELTSRIRSQVAQDRRIDKVLEVTVTQEFFGADPGVRIVVVAQAKGRTLRPMQFSFKRTV